MKVVVSNQRRFFSIGLPILMLIGLTLLGNSALMVQHPDLAIGVIYDLTLVVPLCYLLLIWRLPIKRITVIPFFVAGIIIASVITPTYQNYHLDLVKSFILPLVELGVITLIILKVRQTIKLYKLKSAEKSDFYLSIKTSAQEVLESERIGNVFATEIGMIYYALFTWRKYQKTAYQYTAYRDNGMVAILITIIFVVAAETIGLHFLLIKWNTLVAWLLFGVSIYTAVQLTGHLKALKRRLVEIDDNSLQLKYGLFGDCNIEFDNIERIELGSSIIEGRNVQQLALLGDLEDLNLTLYLKKPVVIEKAYGIKKKADVIQFYLDEPQQFAGKLNEHLID